MILIGQANAWYANQPEDNIVKDIKRKIKIAILLMIPNAATLGSALMIALTVISTDDPIKSWNAIVLGIGLCCYRLLKIKSDVLFKVIFGY